MPENEFDIQEKETKQYISVKIGEENLELILAMLIISSECRRLQECQRRRSTLRVS